MKNKILLAIILLLCAYIVHQNKTIKILEQKVQRDSATVEEYKHIILN